LILKAGDRVQDHLVTGGDQRLVEGSLRRQHLARRRRRHRPLYLGQLRDLPGNGLHVGAGRKVQGHKAAEVGQVESLLLGGF